MRVVVGRIGRAHGIRGEVAIDVRTDEPDRRFAPESTLIAGDRTLTVSRTRWHSGRLLAAFVDVADRTAAESLRGIVLEADVDPDELPAGEEEFYDRQLIGLEVRTAADAVIGTVAAVTHHDEQDTLVVQRGADAEVLVPFVTAIVPIVDVAGGYVVLADVPGLIDQEQAE